MTIELMARSLCLVVEAETHIQEAVGLRWILVGMQAKLSYNSQKTNKVLCSWAKNDSLCVSCQNNHEKCFQCFFRTTTATSCSTPTTFTCWSTSSFDSWATWAARTLRGSGTPTCASSSCSGPTTLSTSTGSKISRGASWGSWRRKSRARRRKRSWKFAGTFRPLHRLLMQIENPKISTERHLIKTWLLIWISFHYQPSSINKGKQSLSLLVTFTFSV